MANTQINIDANGTTTLATVGKYCDRNIDVNVNVPASGITPTGSKTITTNGTHDVTNYANAVVSVPTGITPTGSLNITENGTHNVTNYANAVVNVPTGITPTGSITIDANGTHDVTNYASAVVNVSGAQATQFTNLYDVANVTVKTKLEASSSGVTYTADNQCNYIKIPYHHVKNEPVVLRIRGIGTVRDRYNSATLASDGTTRVGHYSFAISSTSYFTMGYDEYGDIMITFKGNLITTEWYYFAFNFQYVGTNTNATAVVGPIITINEPIGNGGYAG